MPASRRDQLESHRRISRLRIIDTLRAGSEMSRADVARATGLSRPMVSNLVNELRSTGLVLEDAEPVPVRGRRGGRPPIVLRLDASAGGAGAVGFRPPRGSVGVLGPAPRARGQRGGAARP